MTLASKHKFVIMEDRYVGGEGGDEGCVGVRVVMDDEGRCIGDVRMCVGVREWTLMRLCAQELMVFVS